MGWLIEVITASLMAQTDLSNSRKLLILFTKAARRGSEFSFAIYMISAAYISSSCNFIENIWDKRSPKKLFTELFTDLMSTYIY